MNIQKFFLFSKEFNLMEGEKKLTRDDLVEVFKKNANYSKELYLQDFEKIIFKLSEKLYKDDVFGVEAFLNRICKKKN